MTTIEAIETIEQELAVAVTRFLFSRGWQHTSNNPASLWLWEKTIDGVQYRGLTRETALLFERYLEGHATQRATQQGGDVYMTSAQITALSVWVTDYLKNAHTAEYRKTLELIERRIMAWPVLDIGGERK